MNRRDLITGGLASLAALAIGEGGAHASAPLQITDRCRASGGSLWMGDSSFVFPKWDERVTNFYYVADKVAEETDMTLPIYVFKVEGGYEICGGPSYVRYHFAKQAPSFAPFGTPLYKVEILPQEPLSIWDGTRTFEFKHEIFDEHLKVLANPKRFYRFYLCHHEITVHSHSIEGINLVGNKGFEYTSEEPLTFSDVVTQTSAHLHAFVQERQR